MLTELKTEAPLKVAFVMGKMNAGGKKTLAMEYFRHFDSNRVRICFVCDEDSQSVPEEEIKELGGSVSYVAPYQKPLRNIEDMKRLFDAERFDIVHSFNSTMNIISMYAARQSNVKMRISESLSMAHRRELKTYLKLVLRPFSKLFATHYMACGEDCGRWQFGDKLFDQGKVSLFRTAIDSQKYTFDERQRISTRKQWGFSDDEYVVGFIGRFEPQKNPLFMLEVFNEIVGLNAHSKLLLVGDGSMREEMLSYIEAKSLLDNVVYLGVYEDIIPLYQAMDSFLLPSLYEGLPVVGLEAQCCGLDVFFSSEITREAAFCELGHFISLGTDARSWAERMLEVHNLQIPRISRSNACEQSGFDSCSEASRLMTFYDNGCGEAFWEL